MKLTQIARKRKESRNGKRFYTSRDMAIIKHDQAVHNSKHNRGDIVASGQNFAIKHCGCGVEGCLTHYSYPNK